MPHFYWKTKFPNKLLFQKSYMGYIRGLACALVVATYFMPVTILAQKTFARDSLLGYTYATIADTGYSNVDTCLHYTHLALPLLKRTGQWERYIRTRAGLSYCYNAKDQLDSLLLANLSTHEEALRYLPTGHQLHVATSNNLGISYQRVYQDYDRALVYYQEALDHFDADRNRIIFKANILKNISQIYLAKGDFERAERYLQQALYIYQEAFRAPIYEGKNIRFRLVEVYESLARVARYRQDFAAAQAYLLDNLELIQTSERTFADSYYSECYLQLAETSLQLADLPAARRYLHLAKAKRPAAAKNARLYQLKSQLALREGDTGTALNNIEHALTLLPDNLPVDVARLYQQQGRILCKTKQWAAALTALNNAQRLLLPDEPLAESATHIDPALTILSRSALIDVLQWKARAKAGLATRAADVVLLEQALVHYRQMSNLSDQLRQAYQTEEAKLFLSGTTHDFYEEGIAVAEKLYTRTQAPEYLEAVLYFIEKSKAAVLLEEIKAKEARGIYTIPTTLAQALEQCRIDINYYEKLVRAEGQKAGTTRATELAAWNRQLIHLLAKQEHLQERLHREHPAYTTYSQSDVTRLETIRQQLSSGQAVVEYFLGQAHSYALCIRSQEVTLRVLPPQNTLAKLVDGVLGYLKQNRPADRASYLQQAHRLYTLLLQPFDLTGIDQLTIVPDASLAALPFEVLLTSEPVASHLGSRRLPYLLRQYAMHYAYSMTLLQRRQDAVAYRGEVLVVAPVFQDQPGKQLTYSVEPLTALAGMRQTRLLRQEATRANFMQVAHRFGLLHLSTHATASDSVLQQPAIDFIDGPLYLSDLYTLDLPTDLVVLSACEAGLGNQRKGEGLLSLARGFTYAGVPSVLPTLWKVNEKTTHDLVDQFYTLLAEGLPKHRALQQAKLAYLDQCADTRAAPYYWAGFVLIGGTEPFRFEQKLLADWWPLWLGLSLLVIGGSWYGLRTKKLIHRNAMDEFSNNV